MGFAYGTHLSANNWYQHDSYSTTFLLSSTCLVSFPPPAQLPPLCYYAVVLVYKYLVSRWLHPVSEMTRSFFSTYTVPCFHLHIPFADFLSTGQIPLHFVVQIFTWFRLLVSKYWALKSHKSLFLPQFKVHLSHYNCKDFSWYWIKDYF